MTPLVVSLDIGWGIERERTRRPKPSLRRGGKGNGAICEMFGFLSLRKSESQRRHGISLPHIRDCLCVFGVCVFFMVFVFCLILHHPRLGLYAGL